MIHSLTQIVYLDQKRQLSKSTFVSMILQDHANRIVTEGDDRYIKFEPGEMVIRDNYGWTELFMIRKHEFKHPVQWVTLGHVYLGQPIIVTADELVPVFYPNITKDGHHGRVLYAYHIRPATALYHGMYLRLVSSYDPEHPFLEVDPKKRNQDGTHHAYDVFTKSGMYSANGIILNGHGMIDEGVVKLTEYGWN